MASVCAFDGRNTYAPTRTTAPALAMPPRSTSGSSRAIVGP